MAEKTYDYHVSINILGESGVGKTAIIKRFIYGTSEPVEFHRGNEWIGTINICEKTVKLTIKDKAQRDYNDTFKRFARIAKSDAYVIVFDISHSDTFLNINYLLDRVFGDSIVLLLGNKYDLKDGREVTSAEAERFASIFGIKQYIETSATYGYNINEAFEFLVKAVLKSKYHYNPSGTIIKDEKKTLLAVAKEKKEKEKALRKNLNRAKKEHGKIPVRFLKLFFTGSGAAGKTSFISLLLKRKFNRVHHSTNVVHTNHAVSVKKTIIHGSTSEVTWTEFDSKLEISHLHSVLLPKPIPALSETDPSTKSYGSVFPTEEVANPSKLTASINQYKSPARPQQPVIKKMVTQFFTSSVKDSNLSTFDSIVNATPNPFACQPGEVLNIITLLDTGGQPEYIHLLPTINIYPTVTFVIHDLSKSLSDQVLVEYSQHGKHIFAPYHLSYSNLDMIKLLLSAANDALEKSSPNFLQLVTTPGTNQNSYVCLVGTHADKVQRQVKEDVGRDLVALVDKFKCETAVWQNEKGEVLFAVDNTTAGDEFTEDPEANVIRKRIEILAQQKDVYELPITWMLLELEIRHSCSKKQQAYISFQECVAIARETSLMSEVEDVKSVLLYHHLLGVLIYFDKVPGLCDYVIVDHQWWFDKLSDIFSITFQASLDYHAVQRLKYQGLLTKELLQHVEWKDSIKEEFFLSLLVHMRIIVPIFTEKELEEYFIPFILPTCNLMQKSELFHQYGHLQGKPLLCQFQSGFLPRGVFCSLIVELLQHSPRSWHPHFSHEGVHHSFSNLITFRVHDGYSLSLLDQVSYLEVQIRHSKENCSTPIHNGVYNYLVYALTEVCIRLNFDYERLQYGFVCQCGKGIDNHIAVIPDITSSMRYAECTLDSLYLMNLDSSHFVWFSLVEISSLNKDYCKPSNSSGDQKTMDSLIEDNFDKPALKRPTMRLLHEVVIPRIAADWSIVADYLEYEVEYKRIIKERCQNDPVKCCVELLEDWLSSNRGVSPKSWSRLIEALRGIRCLTATTEKIVQDLAKAGSIVTM